MDNVKVYTIGEVCEELNNKGFKEFHSHNLRYLEKVLENVFEIRRDQYLNRVYVIEDIDKIKTVLSLKEQGLNYNAIKNVLLSSNEVQVEVATENDEISLIESSLESKEIVVLNENFEKFKNLIIENMNSSIENVITPKMNEIKVEVATLKKQNDELKYALEKQQEAHFRQIDEKLSRWREESKKKKEIAKKSWFRRIFFRD